MTPSSNLCGVGINFKPDATGALEVHSIVPGSPAAADNQIKQGDVLEKVNSDPTVTNCGARASVQRRDCRCRTDGGVQTT